MTDMDRDAVVRCFEPLFLPRTIAVVGASTKGANLANLFIRRVRAFGYAGTVYPIHPSASSIEGLPAFRGLAETPQPIDYAYVSIAAPLVPDLLGSAGGRVRYAQVISSGFGETAEGNALEKQLVEAARTGGMRLLGPNCMGIYSPRAKVTYTEVASPEVGSVGVASQSGGLSTDIIRRGLVRGIKFSGVVSIGNSADVNAVDLLRFYLADGQTKVIGLYIESSNHGRELFKVLSDARATKPVVILKGGRSADGAVAAASHTGSMAADSRVWDALSRQTGVVLMETLNEFINALLVFSSLAPTPRKPTQEVVLFGNGGGASVLGVDSFSRAGLRVRRFGETTLQALHEFKALPGTSIDNPIDAPVGAMQQNEGRVAERILDAVFATARLDAFVMHLSMPAFAGRTKTEVLDNLVAAALRTQLRYPGSGKFVLVLRSDGNPQIDERKRRFRDRAISLGIPVYDELEDAARALAALARYERFAGSRRVQYLPRAERQVTPTNIIAAARQRRHTSLDEAAGKALLAHYGIAVPRGIVVESADEADAAVSSLKPPFVVKVMSPDILHKSDSGGVRVNVPREDVGDAIRAMSALPMIADVRVDGWLVEEMVSPGQEMIVGGLRDPHFGPLVMVGIGGIFVEALQDVSFRICPITARDAAEMLDELKGAALIRGVRGRAALPRDAIIDALLKMGGNDGILMQHSDDLHEADINPLIVSSGSAVAADARFVLTCFDCFVGHPGWG
jgi:acyl-CoA synthetase (NDP forming)